MGENSISVVMETGVRHFFFVPYLIIDSNTKIISVAQCGIKTTCNKYRKTQRIKKYLVNLTHPYKRRSSKTSPHFCHFANLRTALIVCLFPLNKINFRPGLYRSWSLLVSFNPYAMKKNVSSTMFKWMESAKFSFHLSSKLRKVC